MDIGTALWTSPSLVTVQIDTAGAGTTTLYTPPVSRWWRVHFLFVKASSGAGTMTFQSAAVDLTGAITLDGTASTRQRFHQWYMGGAPFMVARAQGDALRIVTTGASMNLDGFVTLTTVDRPGGADIGTIP